MDILEFYKIKRENIFANDFNNFIKNNKIAFSENGIAVIYAPNGVGKTSLSKVLDCQKGSEFDAKFGTIIVNEKKNDLFHVISDQNSRHIIQGETEEFLLGDDIRKEFELKKKIDNEIAEVFENKLPKILKDNFNISKTKGTLINLIEDSKLKEFISDIANAKSRGKGINIEEFANKIKILKVLNIKEYSEDRFNYYIKDIENKESIINKINDITENDIRANEKVEEIEENNVAIEILSKYSHKKQCIVCDNSNLPDDLLIKKKENKENVFSKLNATEKFIIKEIIEKIPAEDPFNIKEKLVETMKSGNKEILHQLSNDFNEYTIILNQKINNLFANKLLSDDLIKEIEEYYTMIKIKPELSDEDILYIQEIINNNIDKSISLERDKNNNLKLMLNNTEFIGKEREELNLSTGEQNFISLTFELLKAKNNDKQIIILDDPISSFDSIYKNKIVYSIVKFLENKKQIILTHNTDLIRLLEVQKENCFKLYLLNNIEGQENGFIEVTDNEKKIMIFIPDLLDFIRNNIDVYVKDERLYLYSLIPFMRGYAKFIGDISIKNQLTALMHGYTNDKINITDIYNKLFNKNIVNIYEISVSDILGIDINNIDILNNDYPLLNKTLSHSLTYLYLRLLVERKLVTKFNINTKKSDNLGAIILKAYSGTDKLNISKRIFLISKKTLLNEFNHFEGNMSIFQPAIDISDYTLMKEKTEIIDFINNE